MNIFNNKIFRGLTQREKEIITQYIQREEYEPGTFIVRMGESDYDLFLMLEGEAEAITELTELGRTHTHKIFHTNEMFGELAFLTKARRTLDIVAKTSVVVARLSSKIITDHPELYLKIQPSILNKIIHYISATNRKQINYFKNEIKLLKIKAYQNQILLFVISDFSIALMINHLIVRLGVDIYSSIFAGIYLLIILLPLIIIILYNKLPFSTLGISSENLAQSLKEGVFITLSLAMTIIFLYYQNILPHKGHFLSPETIVFTFFEPRTYMVYLYHVTLQQFIRTYFQNSLYAIFEGKFFPSALLSSYCFGLLHIHLGFFPVLVTFLAGMIFAYLYYRHKNVWGIIIIQFFTGTLMFNLEIF